MRASERTNERLRWFSDRIPMQEEEEKVFDSCVARQTESGGWLI